MFFGWEMKIEELQDLFPYISLSAAILLKAHAAALYFGKNTDNSVRNCTC